MTTFGSLEKKCYHDFIFKELPFTIKSNFLKQHDFLLDIYLQFFMWLVYTTCVKEGKVGIKIDMMKDERNNNGGFQLGFCKMMMG